MHKFEFKLPDIGEGVTEGEIVNWLVEVGDVPVGGVLVVFQVEGAGGQDEAAALAAGPAAEMVAESPTPSDAHDADDGPVAVGDLKDVLPGIPSQSAWRASATAPSVYFNEQPLAAPATRKLARELGVDLRLVEPSGKGGRVTREDLERHLTGKRAAEVPAQAAVTVQPAPEPGFVSPQLVQPRAPSAAEPTEERIAIRGLRRRIYENMARSKHTAAHFTYVDECDVSRLRELRERAKSEAERNGLKLTFLPFIIKAVVAALKLHPQLNSVVDDSQQQIVRRHNFHIGVAAATDAGLIVPVLREADRLSILEVAAELERLGTAAREGKIRPEDLGGSSFTITSLGKLGGLFATPVVNYPEVAILGVHEMKQRAVVRDDRIVVGELMMLSLSFDHRIIDGHVGAAFAQEIIGLLEQPERLIVAMH
jgi:pyruvate dehydrogenase E2 component (dihydrolipoamide acetyltransferase)